MGDNEGIVSPGKQHPGEDGHLPPIHENVKLVGQVDVTPRTDDPDPGEVEDDPDTSEPPDEVDALTGKIADVAAWGDYAWLGAFREPTCEEGGLFTIDISDPTDPVEVEDAFIPSREGTYVSEGAHVIDVDNPTFTGQILIHNIEICDFGQADDGGIALWDVTDPENPEFLSEMGDETTLDFGEGDTFTFIHEYHSAFGWNQPDPTTGEMRTFVVGVDNDEGGETDVDIFDITNPATPVLVAETGKDDWPEAEVTGFGANFFIHDMVVKELDEGWRMLVSYWDAGYIILDIDDPENPEYLRQTVYDDTEPFAEEMGLPEGFQPEGNAHYAEFTHDDRFFFTTDEDFNPFRVSATITSGDAEGTVFSGQPAAFGPEINEDTEIAGSTRYVGLACADDLPPPDGATIAVVQRGGCEFQTKVVESQDAGYEFVVVFNSQSPPTGTCETILTMGGGRADTREATIPAVFVARSTGLLLLGEDPGEDPCAEDPPAVGTAGAEIGDFEAIFDGWGYIHMHDTQTMERIDTFAIPEALDADFAEGFGDLSVHEVATDPEEDLVYVSYYSGGFRVLSYDEDGMEEVGAYIHEDGNNFWGVEVHEIDGEKYILASDRDSGLWIFQYLPDVEFRRLAGRERMETAIEVSKASFPDGADTVVLARQDIYPDALAGAPLAFAEDAPILLTVTDQLVDMVAAEIRRLDPSNVILLGGDAALSEEVVADIVAKTDVEAGDIERIGGPERFSTAALIADRIGGEAVYVAEGGNIREERGWPDALAVSALAAFEQKPILLVLQDELPGPTAEALGDYDEATIVGGSFAVSERVEAEIDEIVEDVDRVRGDTRYETAVAIAGRAEEAGMSPASLWVATGERFPDSLVAGPQVARDGGILILVASASLDGSPAARDYVREQADRIRLVTLLGGEVAISAAVEAELRALLVRPGAE
jgi:putative cell wall-binding protein